MVSNSAEHLLAAFLLFIWRRGCPKILYSDCGGNLLASSLTRSISDSVLPRSRDHPIATMFRAYASGLFSRY